MKFVAVLLLPIFIFLCHPCIAVYEGSSNADIFIKVNKQREDYGCVALWHEAAAECINLISMPMNEIYLKYYKRHGMTVWVERTNKERVELLERYDFHIKQAKAAWKKSKTKESVLKVERDKIEKFKHHWLPHYPDRFYDYGIYPTCFRVKQEFAEKNRDYAKVINLEADAAEMCAAQYDLIPIKFGLKKYEKIRDAYLRHAAKLRTLAIQSHNELPQEARISKKIRQQKFVANVYSEEKTDKVLQMAKTDPRLKRLLRVHTGIREYAWYQGFTWTVGFYNHGWGNIAIAIVDDKTGKVKDVLVNEELIE